MSRAAAPLSNWPYKYLSWFLLMCGGYLPGTEDTMKRPMPFFCIARSLSFISFVTTFVYVGDMGTQFVIDVQQKRAMSAAYKSISVINYSLKFAMFHLLIVKRKRISDIFLRLTTPRNIQFQDKFRKGIQKKAAFKISLIQSFTVVGLIVKSYTLLFYPAFRDGKPAFPSIMPGDRQSTYYFAGIVVYAILFSGTFFMQIYTVQWLTMTMMKLISTELEVCRRQLNHIIGILEFHPTDGKCFRMELDEVLTATLTKVEDDVMGHQKALKRADKLLNEWIQHHAFIMRSAKEISDIFGMTAMFRALQSAVLMITLTFLTRTNNIPIGFSTLAPLNMATFYFLSSTADSMTSEGFNVASDAIGMDWNIYPLAFQKKIYLILMIVHNCPITLNVRKSFRLGIDTFYEVARVSYSLVSFMYGML